MRRFAMPVWILVAALIVGLVAASGRSGTRAHDGTPAVAGHALVGSWQVTYTFAGQTQPPVQLISLATYAADGTVVVANAGQLPVVPLGAGLFFTCGHGAWSPSGANGAEATYRFLMLDQSGGLASVNTVRSTVEVDATGDAYAGTFMLDMVTPRGTPFAPQASGTFEATRIRVEAMGATAVATPAATPAMGTPMP